MQFIPGGCPREGKISDRQTAPLHTRTLYIATRHRTRARTDVPCVSTTDKYLLERGLEQIVWEDVSEKENLRSNGHVDRRRAERMVPQGAR